LVLAAAAILAVAAFFASRRAPATRAPAPAPVSVPARMAVPAAAPLTVADIPAIEQRLQATEKAYAEAMRRYAELRQKLLAGGAAKTEVADAKRAIEEALDRHPAVVAMREQLARIEESAGQASTRQAELLDALHAATRQRDADYRQAIDDVLARMQEARRKEVLEPGGHKTLSKLTPEEMKKLAALQDKYMGEYHDLVAKRSERKPGEAEQKLLDEYQSLGEARAAAGTRYAQTYQEMAELRLRLRAEDSEIAALNRALIARNSQCLADLDRQPEMAAAVQEMQRLGRQRAELATQLAALQIQRPATAPVPAEAASATTNG
jgi:hypothetical protein